MAKYYDIIYKKMDETNNPNFERVGTFAEFLAGHMYEEGIEQISLQEAEYVWKDMCRVLHLSGIDFEGCVSCLFEVGIMKQQDSCLVFSDKDARDFFRLEYFGWPEWDDDLLI